MILKSFTTGWQKWTERPGRLALALAVLVTLALYSRALALPLYMDDVIYGRYASGVTLPELFYHLNIVPYYRPLSLVPWKLLEMLTGHYPPPAMHALNLIVHVVNGWLVGVIAKRSTGRTLTALLAGLLYLTFPFSYQAVPWAAALGHLMALCGVLVALVSLSHWGDSRSTLARAGIWLGVALAIFSHENGIVAAAILLLYIVMVGRQPLSRADAQRLFAPILVLSLIFVLIWLQLPKDRDAFQFSLNDAALNALYFSQGLTYPVAWLVNLLSLGDHAGALLALVLTGAGFALAFRFVVSQRRVMLFGLLWYAAAVSVPVVFLSHAYAIDGPRLMLLASGGAALVWASLIDGLAQRRGRVVLMWVGRGATLVLVALTAILGGVFVLQRMELHARLSDVYQTVWDASDRDTVFVNLPAWMAYQETTFPMGSEGITYLTDYIGFPDLVLLNTDRWGDSLAVERDDLRPEFPGYYLGNASPQPGADAIAADIDRRGQGYLFSGVADRMTWLSVRREDSAPTGEGYAWANGIRAWADILPRSDPALLPVAITWQVTSDPATLPDDLTAFVHLECGGALVSQADGAPLRGAFPFRRWRSGDLWREQRSLPAAGDAADCQLVFGLYSSVTGERVPLADGGDAVALPLSG